jgi:hypothetical protein
MASRPERDREREREREREELLARAKHALRIARDLIRSSQDLIRQSSEKEHVPETIRARRKRAELTAQVAARESAAVAKRGQGT